ncbi:TPA: hypothetical protein DCE37_14975 [Candidatus Latescibacteria bacterium]|nr:hypothetical protein [Candidatus Latescibacterota bacterium]
MSDRGHQQSVTLGERLRQRGLSTVYTSGEPKAVQTCQGIAQTLDLDTQLHNALGEHDLTGTGFLDRSVLEQSVAKLFRQPGERVFGAEMGTRGGRSLWACDRRVTRASWQDRPCMLRFTLQGHLPLYTTPDG